MDPQKISNQKGEIEFRKHLYQEQIEGKDVFKGKLGYDSIDPILQERINKTIQDFTALKSQYSLSAPFLEIGAERCQRALTLENDFSLPGCALDISFDMLNSCTNYSKIFSKPKLPSRVCADVYNLPFKSGSLPFVIAYEMLHHFPSPIPVIQEIYRVLSSEGIFYFDEEPFKKVAHIKLYKGKRLKQHHSGFLRRLNFYLDYFFSADDLIEHEYDVIENHSIPIADWKTAIKNFEIKDVDLISIKDIRSNLYNKTGIVNYIKNFLLGGVIRGTCIKKKSDNKPVKSIMDALICPQCKMDSNSEVSLEVNGDQIKCSRCETDFPVKNDIIFLFSKKSLNDLYPEFSKASQK